MWRAVTTAVTHFNSRRYRHAHDGWQQAAVRGPVEERDLYEGLILITWGLRHLELHRAATARRELAEGLAMLQRYGPVHRGLIIEEVVDVCTRLVSQLDEGTLPYLVPPLLKYAEYASDPQPSTDE